MGEVIGPCDKRKNNNNDSDDEKDERENYRYRERLMEIPKSLIIERYESEMILRQKTETERMKRLNSENILGKIKEKQE